MSVFIPDVRVGQPIAFGGVAVFPLYSERSLLPDGDSTSGYALAHEAMAVGTVAVREVLGLDRVALRRLPGIGPGLPSFFVVD